MEIVLKIPGTGGTPIIIDSSTLPTGVPTGGMSTLNKIASVLIEAALIAALGFALYTIAHAVMNMITSGGDKERFAQGRERLRYAIIGLLIIFSALFVIMTLGKFFGIKLLGSK